MRRNRRSIRLRGYDYSRAGAYFVTICAQHRKCLFGDIVDGKLVFNENGQIVLSVWHGLTNHYSHVELDAFVVMPNHVHGIIVLHDDNIGGGGGVGAGFKPAPTVKPTRTVKRHVLSEIIRGFKTFSARRINEMRESPGTPVWQRNYYEHIIRNDGELNRIREYIENNPTNWETDRENPLVRARRTVPQQEAGQ